MKLKVTITAHEAIEKGIWDDLCELRGWNVWIVNEGRMDSDHEIELTEQEARKLRLLPQAED